MEKSHAKRILKKTPKYLGITVLVIILLLAVVPFLIPVKPLEGLISNRAAAVGDSNFVTIPFEGTDGLDIHYFDRGVANDDSKTFVLLHGFVYNAFTWNKVMGVFAEQGRVVAYDQVPYGLSEKPVEGDWTGANPYTTEAAIEQLFSFIDALELNNVVLVGNSYGATLAVRATTLHPERIDALILGNAAVYVQEAMPSWVLGLPQVRRMGPLFTRAIGESESFINQTYFDPNQISDERMGLTTVHAKTENWDVALWEYLSVWANPDLSTDIKRIQQPTLVITGGRDGSSPLC